MQGAESFSRLIAMVSSCLRMVEVELGRATVGAPQPGIEEALLRVQRLRPVVELIELLGGRAQHEGDDDDGRHA